MERTASAEMTNWRSYVCRHVAEQGAPVLSVYQADDGLEVLCGGDEAAHGERSVVVESWGCVVKRDPSLLDVEVDLDAGVWCYREAPGAPWIVERNPAEDAA